MSHSKKLLEEIQKVENQYGSVMNAPDDVMEPIVKISASLESETGHPVIDHRVTNHSLALTAALNRVDTSTMTADEIMDYLNTDIDVTYDGTKFMNKHTVYALLTNRHVPYKRKSRREYNKPLFKAKKEGKL